MNKNDKKLFIIANELLGDVANQKITGVSVDNTNYEDGSKHLSIVKEKGKITSPLQILFLSIHCLIPVVLIHLQGVAGEIAVLILSSEVSRFVQGVQIGDLMV